MHLFYMDTLCLLISVTLWLVVGIHLQMWTDRLVILTRPVFHQLTEGGQFPCNPPKTKKNKKNVAAQGSDSGGHVTMASVYAPVERQERVPFFQQSLLPAMPAGTPLLLGGDWNCVAEDLDLIGGQPGTRQHGFQSGLLPFQQALGLQDAFRCLHPQARESTHTATNNASSARIDRWLVSDSLLPNVSAASVTDLILSDHYGVAVTVSPSNAPPCGPGLWSMPPAIISHPAFKTLMTAQIQTFLHANPVTITLSRAARWDQLKVHIQDVVRDYCFTFHAQRTGQLRVLRVRASKARAAYVAAPGSQHALDELRHTAAALLQHRQQQAATDALRAGVLLHEYGDQSTYYFHHLHSRLQSLVTCSSTRTPQWQTFALWTADSRLTAALSTSFQLTAPQACTDSCLLTCQRSKPCCLHWTGGCHHMRAKVQSRASHLMSCKQLSSCLLGARSQAQMGFFGQCSVELGLPRYASLCVLLLRFATLELLAF